MKNILQKLVSFFSARWTKIVSIAMGMAALVWFLIRVIPKPSRASYPCQQAAFPLASAFVIWLTGLIGSLAGIKYLGKRLGNYRWVAIGSSAMVVVVLCVWLQIIPSSILDSFALGSGDGYQPAVGFNWIPGPSNQPIGDAKGVYPGRVVMTRNPEATKWSGNWQLNEDQWWLDENTDTEKVAEMLSVTLQELTGTKKDKKAWDKIFKYYNKNSRGLTKRGYEPGEVVAVKINLNNSGVSKVDNQSDASPQMVLAMIRQLVNEAGIPQKDIFIYDARRQIYPYMLTTIWKEFKDVRFLQWGEAQDAQPVNPAYGDHTGIEAVDWVEGISYSAGKFNEAKLIPRQVKEATYLVNFAMLKLHSYPYNYMEDGDEGQTAVTMSAKNHAGSIKGTPELHDYLDTKKLGTKNAYSPLVDLATSPNLGAKTILYLLDGLYCGRKWRTYPLHFPNPPFNNKVEPYENSEWPACLLASFDCVALQSVGLDIMYAQSKNNNETAYHDVPRILVRDNADDFLREMADPDHAPSGTRYIQGGKPIESLGVFEHWDDDLTMRYSRNLDPKNGKGIELIYLPL
ncbi:DUF362 domain-containing protein [Sunxiuqinia sp. A32]|uniref:DUF362 domain-containing protein n=1 Tax=Sunxiuqinia sp. A32 TaxID=3461496 RepID=UPI0040457A28